MTIRGLKFPFNKGFQAFPDKSEDADTIDDNIRRILQTRLGERVMRPNSGSKLWDYVFGSVGPVLRAQLDHEVRRAIGANEPRARVLQVNVREVTVLGSGPAGEATAVEVNIFYEVNAEVQSTSVMFPQIRAAA